MTKTTFLTELTTTSIVKDYLYRQTIAITGKTPGREQDRSSLAKNAYIVKTGTKADTYVAHGNRNIYYQTHQDHIFYRNILPDTSQTTDTAQSFQTYNKYTCYSDTVPDISQAYWLHRHRVILSTFILLTLILILWVYLF